MTRSNGRGSAALELALVLPLALVAALALVQVGLVTKDSLVVVQAARDGAREAAVTTDDDRIRAAVLRSGLEDERTELEVTRQGSVGDPVTVDVRYRAPLVVPFVEWLFPDEVILRAGTTMRQETDGSEG